MQVAFSISGLSGTSRPRRQGLKAVLPSFYPDFSQTVFTNFQTFTVSIAVTDMKTLHGFLRCITSRQVCFPLIFTIAAVSMILSIVQFSRMEEPVFKKQKRASFPVDEEEYSEMSPREIVPIQFWEEWIPDSPVNPDFQPQKLSSEKDQSKPRKAEKTVKDNDKVNPEAKNGLKRQNEQKPKSHKVRNEDYYATNFSDALENYDNSLLFENIVGDDNKTSNIVEKLGGIATLPPQTKGVIIITNYRSGSTFLGELFNQHPKAFYTFEPLYPFGSNCTFEVSRRIDLLRNMMRCDFPEMKKLYEDLDVDYTKSSNHQSCVTNNFCFRHNHKELCTPDLCSKGDAKTCFHCGLANLNLVNHKCRTRKVSAIKVIKLCDIMELEPLVHDPSIDFKIIHLVRDPRGIASSRLKIHKKWDVADQIIPTCLRQAHNVRAGRNMQWLRGRYKLIRYEDMARNPMQAAHEIYKFVGLPFELDVERWIKQNTQSVPSKSIDLENIRAQRVSVNDSYDAAKDPYSTTRNSNEAMQAWRKHLPFATVEKIQKKCVGALRSLGYKDFNNYSELHNLKLSAFL